jgi:hypothetical protein
VLDNHQENDLIYDALSGVPQAGKDDNMLHVDAMHQEDVNWKMIANKDTQRRSKGNKKSKENELLTTKGIVLTTNRFASLETINNTPGNEYGIKPACGSITLVTDSDQLNEVTNPEQACSTTEDLQEELNANTNVRPNPKTHSATQLHSHTRKEEAYSIPTITNSQISRKDTSKNIKQTTTHQQRTKQKSTKTSVSSTGGRNKILIIGESHARGLSERVRNYMNVHFDVTGITKPNADAKSITSPSHLVAENLTKKDLLIFYGGTRDISRNETNKGLRSLKAFAHRTSNTNVMLLEAPHRHDLPPFSCVNTEVALFNKRLHNLAATFNHLRILSIPIERRFHTNNGLHLNKKGKDWIASSLVKQIRKVLLPDGSAPPIVLPWKDIDKNVSHLALGNQVSPTTSRDVQECLSPDSRSDDSQEPGEDAEGKSANYGF